MTFMKNLDQQKVKEFNNLYGVKIIYFCDNLISVATNCFHLDIIKFTDYAEEHLGYYVDVHGSLEDFIKKTGGEKMADFLKSLL